jgi:hypothetical protein
MVSRLAGSTETAAAGGQRGCCGDAGAAVENVVRRSGEIPHHPVFLEGAKGAN